MRNPLPPASSLILAVAMATSPAAWSQPAPQAARAYEDALARFEKKDFAGAIVQLKNALKADNRNLSVQLLLGKALLANGELVAAEVAFSEALRLGVNRAEVVLPLARSVVDQGKQQEILENARFAVAGLPPAIQAPLLLVRAGAAADLGDSRSALRAIDEARALEPDKAASWLSEVPVRIRARQLREAQLAAEKAIALAPDQAEALYVRGTVSHVQNDLNGALSWYDKALKVRPGHVDALVSRAGLYFDLKRLTEAARDVEVLLATAKTEPRGVYLKALIAEREGQTAAARAAYNDVTALLDPVPIQFLRYRPQLLMLGGLSHYALQQFEKAKPYLELIQRAQPTSPVSKLLAQIHLRDRNLDRAIESLDQYLRAHPRDAQAVLLLASTHMAQGRHSRATQLTQEALKLQDSPSLQAALGLSLVGAGKVGNAVVELEAAYKKDPGQIQAGSALASIYIMSGQPNRAQKTAEALVKQQPKNPGLLNLLGSAQVAAGHASLGRSSFEQAVLLDGLFAAPQINLARLDAQEGRHDAAVGRLNAVLAREERNVDALTELGRIAESRNRLPDAQRWFEKADDFAGPNNFQAGLALVDFHLRHRQPVLARQATTRLTGKAPEAIQVLLALARVSLANGDATSARLSLSRAAGLANYDAPLLLRIALLQIQANHLPGAAHSLGKALEERPDFVTAQAVMAEVEIRQGQVAKGEQRAQQMIARNPKLGVAHALLGDAAMAKGQVAAAVEHYRRSNQVEPSSDGMLRLFRALALGPNSLAATQAAEQWLKSRPNDVAVRRALGDHHARLGNFAAARASYEALVKVAPDDAEALNNLANILVMAKDPDALRVAEAALAKSPGTPHIIGTVGWAAFKAGQTDRALQLLRDARLRDPGNPDTRVFLGSVLASAGRRDEARDELESALKSGRSFAMAKEAEELLRTLR